MMVAEMAVLVKRISLSAPGAGRNQLIGVRIHSGLLVCTTTQVSLPTSRYQEHHQGEAEIFLAAWQVF